MKGFVLSSGGIIMAGEIFELHGQTCPSVTLSSTIPHTLPWYRKQILQILFNLLFLDNLSLGGVIFVVEKMSWNGTITS